MSQRKSASQPPARPAARSSPRPRVWHPEERPQKALIREVANALRLYDYCDLAICRRARACAGRHLPCHAERAEALRPILWSVAARRVLGAAAAGFADRIAPVAIESAQRLLAAERAAVAIIEAGGEAGEGEAHALWLRNVIAPHLRRGGDIAAHQDDGRAPDPGAKLRE